MFLFIHQSCVTACKECVHAKLLFKAPAPFYIPPEIYESYMIDKAALKSPHPNSWLTGDPFGLTSIHSSPIDGWARYSHSVA